MQTFNSVKKVITFVLSGFLNIAIFSPLYGLDMPSMPTLEMPTAPEISMPGFGDSFYKPTVPAMPSSQKKLSETDDKDSEEIEEEEKKSKKTTNDLLNQLITGEDYLKATDISSLYDYGMFSDISTLTGNNLLNSNSSTNILLQQMLNSLDELKEEQKNNSEKKKEQLASIKQDNKTFRTRNPSILRFKINGYNIKDSLTEVFFSETEEDGSFLLTCDRKYVANQKTMTETFYLLFHSVKSNGSVTSYQVVPSIAQDVKNENSFVYKLCQSKDLTAEKTGNLVVLHYSSDGLNSDMLLDIDRE